jgi:hypothetical protein
VQAYKWFYIAAVDGNETAKKGLNLTSRSLTQSQISEAIRLAAEEKVVKQEFTAAENLYSEAFYYKQRIK